MSLTISAADVKRLRDKTDCSMMDCKKALQESAGDFDKAIEWLKEKYKGKIETRADRETGQGRIGVYISPDATTAGIVELRCETAPVARNELFIELAAKLAKAIAHGPAENPTPELINGLEVDGQSVQTHIADVFAKLQETTRIASARKLTAAFVDAYVHHTGMVGCVLGVDARPSDAQAVKDACMHVAFSKSVAITRDQVPAAEVEAFRAATRAEVLAQGKPENIVDKIVDGKMNAFFAERVLPEQEHTNPKYERKSVLDSLKPVGVSKIVAAVVYEIAG